MRDNNNGEVLAMNAAPYDKEHKKGPRDTSWAVSKFFLVYFDFYYQSFKVLSRMATSPVEEDQDQAENDDSEHRGPEGPDRVMSMT
jgi:hypothetical protein